jgi:hypothetical protein
VRERDLAAELTHLCGLDNHVFDCARFLRLHEANTRHLARVSDKKKEKKIKKKKSET